MADESKPSGVLAGAAAVLPTLFLMVGCAFFALVMARHGAGGIRYAIAETGIWFWAVLASTLAAWVGVSVLLFLAARGMRVPGAITLFVAALPWLVGLGGVVGGVSMASDAVAHADPASRSAMMAAGIAEATNARLIGGMFGASLLASVAFGWALGALGQGAPKRSMLGGVLGLGAALPLTGLALYGAFAAYLPGVVLGLAGLGAALAVGLAAGGAGDDRNGRSGALAASTPVAAALAVLASAAVASSASLIEVFGAIARAAADSRASLIGAAAMELVPLSRVVDFAIPVGLFTAAVVAGWAASRSKPSVGRIAGGAALVFAALALFGLDAATLSWTAGAVEEANPSAWQDVAGVEPIAMASSGEGDALDAVLTPNGLVDPAGAALSAGDAGAMTAVLARLRAPESGVEDEVPDWLRDARGGPDGDAPERELLRTEPQLAIAVDRRVTGAQLRELLRAARAADVRAIAIVGPDRDAPPREHADAIRDALPLLGFVIGARGATTVLLEAGVPEGTAGDDPVLFHTTVEGAAPARVAARPGAAVTEDELSIGAGGHRGWDEPERVLYLGFEDAAPAESVLETVTNARGRGFRSVLVAGAIPGEPARPPGLAGADDEGRDDDLGGFAGLGLRGARGGSVGDGPIGLGSVATRGRSRPSDPAAFGPGAESDRADRRPAPPQVRNGSAEVMGSISQEVIRRVVRRHINEVRFCYEQGLARDPSLEGRVTVRFIISASGSVQSATVGDSTLRNPQVEGCIANAVRRWTFPAPSGGGIAIVSYPFVLSGG